MAYPNPTSGALTLFFANAQCFDYEVYNFIGQSVMQGTAVGQEAVINLSDCPQGVYFVSVNYDGKRIVQKVVVR